MFPGCKQYGLFHDIFRIGVKTVGVAVSNATFHFDKLYTYAVMPDQQDTVRLGSMVLVPLQGSTQSELMAQNS